MKYQLHTYVHGILIELKYEHGKERKRTFRILGLDWNWLEYGYGDGKPYMHV